MIHIRVMTRDDIALGMRLKQEAGWNQTEADWQRFLALQPEGCFVAEWNGQPVGTATTCTLDKVSWIGMILVDKLFRGQRIGTQLVEHCLRYLNEKQVRTVRLDATPLGFSLYKKLGFQPDYELVRMTGIATGGAIHSHVVPLEAEKLDSVYRLDVNIRGSNRRRLLQSLYRDQPESMQAYLTDSELLGYVAYRNGEHAIQIGPAVARTTEVGLALVDTILKRCEGKPIFIDIPTDNRAAMQWANSRGLTPQRPLTRMWRGERLQDQPALQWASSGPEKG